MSAKKHVLRLKRRKAASDGDIRYLGPLSYRAFEILGWLCVVMCVGIIVMTVLKSMSSKQGTGQGLPQGILQYKPSPAEPQRPTVRRRSAGAGG